jgi:paraquat-inducible protein B
MSEDSQLAAARRTVPAQAKTHRSWWPGWIWAVPIAALAIGAWLLVRFLTQGGTDIAITFADAYGISPDDTTIQYRGTDVGKVSAVSLQKDGQSVEVEATIQDSAKKLLTTGTLFWLKGAKPSLSDLSSLGSVLSGPKIVMEPGPGKPATHFSGLTRKPILPAGHEPPVLFRVRFDGPVGDLSSGEIVRLRGFPVGEVKEIGFRYNARTGGIETPVTLALYPSLFHIQGAQTHENANALGATIERLVEEGLRAQLDRDPPLIGSYEVAFTMAPGAPNEKLAVNDGLPEIPTASGGGLQSIVDRFKNVPIDQIAQNVLAITKHLDSVVSSPQLKDSVAQLDKSLQDIHRTLQDVSPKIDKLVQSLRDTAQQLEKASKSVDQSLGGPTSQTGLQETLREVKEAARAIRSLADYLEQHPESLISGKPKS